MIKLGALVEIIGGPLNGLRGYVVDGDEDSYKVELPNNGVHSFDEEELEVLK
jgi:hypothetical protein